MPPNKIEKKELKNMKKSSEINREIHGYGEDREIRLNPSGLGFLFALSSALRICSHVCERSRSR